MMVRKGNRLPEVTSAGMILLLACVVARAAEGPSRAGLVPHEAPIISSDVLSIGYGTADGDVPVSEVELWFTRDAGETWVQWKAAPGKAAGSRGKGVLPREVEFRPEADGLYGFYVILRNAAGASSPSPAPGTAPQQWVRVDRTPPTVRILGIRSDDRFAVTRMVEIRWEVDDDNLPDRPVSLHYRTTETKSFRLIAEMQPARSAHAWTVPSDVSGRVEIKVTAIDRAGQRGQGFSELPQVEPEAMTQGAGVNRTGAADGSAEGLVNSRKEIGPHGEPDAGAARVSDAAAGRAKERYDAATWHRLRGEYDLAQARYAEALDVLPEYHAARHDLATMLLLQDRIDDAERELTVVLRAEPDYRPALKSMALIHSRRKNYRSACECLERVVGLEPDDAETWLLLGDVTLFRGDRPAAREAWTKAESLGTGELKRRAVTRLDMYFNDRTPVAAAAAP